jgi:hypothetical protein
MNLPKTLKCEIWAAQRFGLPATDYSKSTDPKTTFSFKRPPQTRAESGQVEPVLGPILSMLK